MSSPSPVLLILGAGPNIGHHVANTFLSHGYRVALASRTTKNHSHDTDNKTKIHIAVDLSRPETIPAVFDTVKTQLGAPPSVAVYNGALRIPNDPKDPLLGTSGSSSALTLSDHETSMAINNTSVLIAMQQSLAGFRELPQPPQQQAGHSSSKATFSISSPSAACSRSAWAKAPQHMRFDVWLNKGFMRPKVSRTSLPKVLFLFSSIPTSTSEKTGPSRPACTCHSLRWLSFLHLRNFSLSFAA
jgi:NAD(P)-dependent dehydrogenase (short-subunit alcohol dehydrogenase family)